MTEEQLIKKLKPYFDQIVEINQKYHFNDTCKRSEIDLERFQQLWDHVKKLTKEYDNVNKKTM